MCGICGFLTKDSITLSQLKEMNDSMIHRGPDDNGEELYVLPQEYSLGLAQRRLSILDLSMLGHQPMHSPDSRISVVFNGEIYNFKEIKAEISEYQFLSECDTEVIIASYLKWGIECVKRFKGMFSIALFDRELQELYLVRDRIGKKPLYYWINGENLVFASELKPIMKCPGFPYTIRKEILGQFLYQQYIAEPNSIFEDVYKLTPGSILCFSKGKVTIEKYWDLTQHYEQNSKLIVTDYQEAKAELKKKLSDSVKHRMIADVPLGTFLSGGYDSTLITAMASELSKDPVKTFTIGFENKSYDEAQYAKEVAGFLGTQHTQLYIGENEMLSLVESIPKYFDEPFADSSQIPSMLVAGLARQKVTVALSGDGGDEFFCGYHIYDLVKQAQQLELPGELLSRLLHTPGLNELQLYDKVPFKFRAIINNRDQETKTQIGGDNYISAISKIISKEQLPYKFRQESRYVTNNWQIKRMLLDMEQYLPGDILCKVDRASMKYSLEARCPILDTDVMEYSFRIPHHFKYHKGIKKYILKDITHDYVPKDLLDRPKSGFSVPMDQWLRGPLRDSLLTVCDQTFLARQDLFEPQETRKLIHTYLETGDKGRGSGANYSRLVWAFYVFQMWHQTYCKQVK